MSTAATIQELARQVRTSTIQLLESADPAALTWAPRGTSNHLIWHAGHALWLGDVLCLEALTGRSDLPPGWAETFGMDCRPVGSTKAWPAPQELLRLLAAQLERIHEAVEKASDTSLARIINTRGDTLASRIIHGFHDEARHQGEMKLLLKLWQTREK